MWQWTQNWSTSPETLCIFCLNAHLLCGTSTHVSGSTGGKTSSARTASPRISLMLSNHSRMNGIALWKLQPVEIPQKHPENQCIQYTTQAVLNSLINCMAANQLYAIQIINCNLLHFHAELHFSMTLNDHTASAWYSFLSLCHPT